MDFGQMIVIARSLKETLKTSVPELNFEMIPHEGTVLFRDCWRQHPPNDELAQKGGVYFLADPKGQVLYIGKAAKTNLAKEIWEKLNVPVQTKPRDDRNWKYWGDPNAATLLDRNSDIPEWANHYWADSESESEARDLIRQGKFMICAIAIEPPVLASLVEVALQTYCEVREGRLPRLNKQIG